MFQGSLFTYQSWLPLTTLAPRIACNLVYTRPAMSKTSQPSSIRVHSKHVRCALTLAFRTSYVLEFGCPPPSEAFRALTNHTYEIVLGADADTLRSRLGATERESVRDLLSDRELSQITEAESLLTDWLTAGYTIQRCLGALWQTKNTQS